MSDKILSKAQLKTLVEIDKLVNESIDGYISYVEEMVEHQTNVGIVNADEIGKIRQEVNDKVGKLYESGEWTHVHTGMMIDALYKVGSHFISESLKQGVEDSIRHEFT